METTTFAWEASLGRTPLLRLARLERALGSGARLLAKAEWFSPTGSAKDRAARAILDDAESRGLLRPGGTVIEASSGNMGIALSSLAAARGYRAAIVMPETMSAERRALLRAFGAEVVLSPGARGMAGAAETARRLSRERPDAFPAAQFSNPANPAAHYRTTGPELWAASGGTIDLFVAGVGTGGTISGAGRYLKERKPGLRVVAVEPAASPVLSGGEAGAHGIQGIGAGFVPPVLELAVIDEVIAVEDAQAAEFARLLARHEGLLAGISSGAALCAAAKLAARAENAGKTIAVLLPDSGERCLSTGLFGG